MKDEKIYLKSCCASLDSGGIWFVEYSYALLLFFDFSGQKITIAEVIPTQKFELTASFFGMYVNKDTVVLIPNTANCIYLYSKSNKTFSTFSVQEACFGLFREAIEYEGNLFCIPNLYNRILKFELNSDEMCYFDIESNEIGLSEKHGILSACAKDNYIYMVIENRILVFDMQLCKFVSKVCIDNSKLSSVDVSEKYIYVFDVNKKMIYCLDRKTLKILKGKEIENKNVKIICFFDTHVIAEAVDTPCRWIFDEQLNIQKEEINESLSGRKGYCFSKWIKTKDYIYEISADNHIILYNPFWKKVFYEINGEKILCQKIRECVLTCRREKKYEVLYESKMLDLQFFISSVLQ